jgi:hypothetical protein
VKLLRVLCWWHLLSFDAPTVAVVWSYFFAHIMGVRLPWSAVLILGLGTWLIYIADRLLDGVAGDELRPLRERHHFYARNRKHFLVIALGVGTTLLWLIATRMSFFTRRDDAIVFGVAMVYFGAIHGSALWGRHGHYLSKNGASGTRAWLPKEVAVAILFAAATAVPAWSRLGSDAAGKYAALSLAVICFAALCWLNCVAIEHWETMDGREPSFNHMHASTEWAGRNLAGIALTVCGIGLYMSAATMTLPAPPSVRFVFLSAALSAAALFALDRFRRNLSSIELRVAADAVLLTPLLFLIQ